MVSATCPVSQLGPMADIYIYNRRNFRSQTSDSMDRWKRRGGKSQRGEEHKREDQRRVGGKKMQVREKLAMSRSTLFDFPMICGSGGSKKSRLAKAAGAEPSGQMRDEKLHAVVARSTFASEEAINTAGLEHFWKLRWRKSARRCGAKQIYKSRCTLDDGWPESVEEQGLLLLVLRQYITRQYIKDLL